MAYYPNPNISGIISASSTGDGYAITLRWATAYPKTKTNRVAYNIYISTTDDYTIPENIFNNPPQFVSISGITSANIVGLVPGELYFFGIRAIEYDPLTTDLNILPNNGLLKFYPTSLLASDITATDLVIPLVDTEFFPASGVVKIGTELISYVSISGNDLIVNNSSDGYIYVSETSLLDSVRGDGYVNSIILSDFTFAQNWIVKCISADGYDGYGNLLPTKFITIGSISGVIIDQYENPIVWYADGTNPRDPNNDDDFYDTSLLPISFNITQGATRFTIGGGFNIKVSNFLGINGGRGYNNTDIRLHNTDGYDGYATWSPLVSLFVGEEEQNTRNFECQNRFEYPNYPATAADGYHQRATDILTTDLSGSDDFNGTLPPYDYSSYHQTDPVALLTGDCVGSYIGGEQFCMDGYDGVGRVLRGMSVQEQNNQRQEVLLSLTGEPVALFHKRRTGITCNCYTPASEYPDDRCKNCLGTGFVIGWEQFFNPRRSDGRILVRFSPADDDLKTTDGGLESELITDCWTMTIPTIKDRDFIIRFDEEDNEEFRYEVLSVNRNKLLDRLSGGQKFKVQRVRKTDPIYTVRAFRNTSLFPASINTGISSVPGLITPHTHTVQISESIINVNQINQITGVSQGHSHSIINGVVQVSLGHTHTLII